MLPPFPSLEALLADFVTKAEADFPEVAGRLCLFDSGSRDIYLGETFDPQAHGFKNMKAFENYIDKHATTRDCYEGDGFAACALKEKEHDLLMIFFNQSYTDTQRQGLTRQDITDAYHTLDHELAHLVIPAAYDTIEESAHNTLLAECIAETYALMRHQQRDPDNAANISNVSIGLAADIALHDTYWKTHYHYPAVRALENVDINDIRRLDIRQTAARAEELARQHVTPQNRLDAIIKSTQRCRNAYAKGGLEAALPVLAEVAFSGKADDITRLAIDACLYHLDKPKNVLVGPQWSKMRQDLKEFDLRLSGKTMLTADPDGSAAPARTRQLLRPWRMK